MKKTPLFRCPSGLAKALDDYKAYANVKGHQRLLLPGYAKERRHPRWHPDKEKCGGFVTTTESAAPVPFISPLPSAPGQSTAAQWEPGQHHCQAPKNVCLAFHQGLLIEAENPETPSCKTNQICSVHGNNKSLARKSA